ncbi:MAG: hypothetical protein ACOVNV_05815, partial [Pirellulaceae bacterium]
STTPLSHLEPPLHYPPNEPLGSKTTVTTRKPGNSSLGTPGALGKQRAVVLFLTHACRSID